MSKTPFERSESTEPVIVGCVIRVDLHECHPEFGGNRVTSKDFTDFKLACEYYSNLEKVCAKSGGYAFVKMNIVFIK